MTQIGTVIDGKYEILKEIGRGGMSTVYLAMDKHLNKQWAVKEIRKRGNGKNDEIVVNSLLAEANMMKRLDHPSLPRIVDILDNGVTIYVVMDYIEGESLDKVLDEYGAQSEELVVDWAKQLCDALGYLHSQKPPIIYRDMKPANIMLKPEGNIKIIDFGIAREYKEQNLADTHVLGTKGYAPPEQYSGQTDARSDIFALGMTMHHLLTGVDPRKGETYAPVRLWNPELSEGIEIIINKCVEPAPENRYQNCADLLYDLEHPELITRNYKIKQKRKLRAFIATAIVCIAMIFCGVSLNIASGSVKKADYNSYLLDKTGTDEFYEAVSLSPEKTEAYEHIYNYLKAHSETTDDNAIMKLGNALSKHENDFDKTDPNVAELFYNVGKMYFSSLSFPLATKASDAESLFKSAAEFYEDKNADEYPYKNIVDNYLTICSVLKQQSGTSSLTSADYAKIFDSIDSTMTAVDKLEQSTYPDAFYDKLAFYYTTILIIDTNAEYIVSTYSDVDRVKDLLESVINKAADVSAPSEITKEIKEKITTNKDNYINKFNACRNQLEKGGN